jgi:hypothetical protein
LKNETIRDALITAVATNAAIATWCDLHFDRDVTVFDGIDRMQLPDHGDTAAGTMGDYPFVALDVTEKMQGQVVDEEVLSVSVFCALLDDSPYEDTTLTNTKRLPGIDKRDQFRALVLAAVVGASIDNGYVQTVESVNLPVEFFPEFAVDMTITIARPYAFRENRFE